MYMYANYQLFKTFSISVLLLPTLGRYSETIRKAGGWIYVFNKILMEKKPFTSSRQRSYITPYSNHFSSIYHYSNFSITWRKIKGKPRKRVWVVFIASWIESKSECPYSIEWACAKLSLNWKDNHFIKSTNRHDRQAWRSGTLPESALNSSSENRISSTVKCTNYLYWYMYLKWDQNSNCITLDVNPSTAVLK